jgi:hypothetical protein
VRHEKAEVVCNLTLFGNNLKWAVISCFHFLVACKRYLPTAFSRVIHKKPEVVCNITIFGNNLKGP